MEVCPFFKEKGGRGGGSVPFFFKGKCALFFKGKGEEAKRKGKGEEGKGEKKARL